MVIQVYHGKEIQNKEIHLRLYSIYLINIYYTDAYSICSNENTFPSFGEDLETIMVMVMQIDTY